MALQMVVRNMVVVLVMYCSTKVQGQLLDFFSEEVTSTNVSHIHTREEREVSFNVSDYLLEVTLATSELNLFQTVLATFNFSIEVGDNTEITSINITTVCSPSATGYECRCQENFAWPNDLCLSHGACSAIIGDTCGCINDRPPNGEQCQLNISQPDVTRYPSTTPETTTAAPKTKATTSSLIEERILQLTIDLNFDPSFSETSSDIYTSASQIIEQQFKNHISNFESATIKEIRSGSTVVIYAVKASNIQASEIAAAEEAVFNKMAEIFPMIRDSTEPLRFQPPEVFFGKNVTVTCGPPPSDFSANWRAEWFLNGAQIPEDDNHNLAIQNRTAMLTIPKFFTTDNGDYECKMRDSSLILKIVVRQRSNRSFILKRTPLIQVSPVKQQLSCEVGKQVLLICSVNNPYRVEFQGIPAAGQGRTISHRFEISSCDVPEEIFKCQEKDFPEFNKDITLLLSRESFICSNDIFGGGTVDDESVGPCEEDKVGELTAVCRADGNWEVIRDGCILQPIHELLQQSQFLNNNSLGPFLNELSNVTRSFADQVTESAPTITAVVEILNNVADTVSSPPIIITEASMTDILLTTGILTIDNATESWDFLNNNDTKTMFGENRNLPKVESVSSELLLSLERFSNRLVNASFNIDTPFIVLNKTTFTGGFNADFDSSVEINIASAEETKALTVMTFESMDNVLPARDKVNSSVTIINGRVVLVQSSSNVDNVSFTFDVLNDTLSSPQCVFWNFTLFDGLGGWDTEGCELVHNINQTVTCNCNHLTSFSILMSPFSLRDPVLDFITYIGVGISMASLVICIIIEGVIWRKIQKNNTSYLRHISIVNIAVSLLIANIWFIIGAAISDAEEENTPACTAATFFIHFFYLALFFWMLASALLLLHRTVSVFDDGLSKMAMIAVGFSLGYGAPLIIAVVTIAVTAPSKQYIRNTGVCWLNWDESKALLAFVIPALLIVLINLIILLVVLSKILRRRSLGGAARAEEKHVLVVIARALAVLTPFFGLTWSLGVGTMVDPHNRGIHITFALFNSLQGFFILLFGTLLDKKVRSEITMKSQTSKSGTRSTSAGTTSSSGLGFLQRWRRGRDGYNISASTSGAFNHSSST